MSLRTPLLLALALYFGASFPACGAAAQYPRPADAAPEDPVVPMVFPVTGAARWSDSFGAPRDGGKRRHHGQDIMAPRMTPLVAVFDGVVTLRPGGSAGGNNLYLHGDNGYRAVYVHINNDTPGTDDGLGTEQYAFAPGLKSGDRVVAGQFIAWVGDSGNAEETSPHCHFELWGPDGCINPAPSLLAASALELPVAGADDAVDEPKPGEVRWDGVVRSYHPEWRILVLQLHATRTAAGQVRPVKTPQTVWIRLRDAALRDTAGAAVEPDVLQPGQRIAVIGRDNGRKAAQARVAAVDLAAVMAGAADMAGGAAGTVLPGGAPVIGQPQP